jgi:hypothetical protein
LTEYSQIDGFFWGSIVASTHWMVLRRPVELAALTRTLFPPGLHGKITVPNLRRIAHHGGCPVPGRKLG